MQMVTVVYCSLLYGPGFLDFWLKPMEVILTMIIHFCINISLRIFSTVQYTLLAP